MPDIPIPNVTDLDIDAELANFDEHTAHIKTKDQHVQAVVSIASRLFGAAGAMAKRAAYAEYQERMASRYAMNCDAEVAEAVASTRRLQAEMAMGRSQWLRHQADCHADPDTELDDLRLRVNELTREIERLTAQTNEGKTNA